MFFFVQFDKNKYTSSFNKFTFPARRSSGRQALYILRFRRAYSSPQYILPAMLLQQLEVRWFSMFTSEKRKRVDQAGRATQDCDHRRRNISQASPTFPSLRSGSSGGSPTSHTHRAGSRNSVEQEGRATTYCGHPRRHVSGQCRSAFPSSTCRWSGRRSSRSRVQLCADLVGWPSDPPTCAGTGREDPSFLCERSSTAWMFFPRTIISCAPVQLSCCCSARARRSAITAIIEKGRAKNAIQ